MLTRWQPSAQTRWQPFGSVLTEMNRLQREFHDLFENLGVNGRGWTALAASYPALNVWEDEGHLYLEAELPGMDLEDLEIFVTGGDQLTLKGERKQPAVENGTWYRQERGFGTFLRTVTLPSPVNADKVEARFLNGVLTITLPKAEAAKPRKITVKSV